MPMMPVSNKPENIPERTHDGERVLEEAHAKRKPLEQPALVNAMKAPLAQQEQPPSTVVDMDEASSRMALTFGVDSQGEYSISALQDTSPNSNAENVPPLPLM